jgi:hypothetical protein
VCGFLLAEFAEFLKFQTLGSVLFVLIGLVIQIVAHSAFQVDKIVLRHTSIKIINDIFPRSGIRLGRKLLKDL